jgi:hypothetical protein
MLLLSELRQPEGNPQQALNQTLSKMRQVNAIPRNWVPLSIYDHDKNGTKIGGAIYQARNEVACQVAKDNSSYALFAPNPARTSTLRELLANHPSDRLHIYDNIPIRLNWMKAVQACVKPNAETLKGEYLFCFRDYVNFEELTIMLVQRKAWELILLRSSGIGKLTICDRKDPRQKSCSLKERFYIFLLIPLAIEWSGQFSSRAHTLNWETSSMRIGWSFFGKTIHKPKASEKLRKDPWLVYYPQEDDSHGEILILHRIGSGKLVYAKKESLMKRKSS